ncbi:hypothetical protein BLNAU_18275 [Blattamonas nauphoetae]|uniref:Uncharacterized protein n=1 Tax=Blattamonas nauphoetae TaxID=2049346 RepID=A0ABQ9X4W8_9EUKA|nr:hypothetical protein BLNAU_18275 [Blattamonas nauphoetae]
MRSRGHRTPPLIEVDIKVESVLFYWRHFSILNDKKMIHLTGIRLATELRRNDDSEIAWEVFLTSDEITPPEGEDEQSTDAKRVSHPPQETPSHAESIPFHCVRCSLSTTRATQLTHPIPSHHNDQQLHQLDELDCGARRSEERSIVLFPFPIPFVHSPFLFAHSQFECLLSHPASESTSKSNIRRMDGSHFGEEGFVDRLSTHRLERVGEVLLWMEMADPNEDHKDAAVNGMKVI